jgi:hypothetical protein
MGDQDVMVTQLDSQLVREWVEDIARDILLLSGKTQQVRHIIAKRSKMPAIDPSHAGEADIGFEAAAMELRDMAKYTCEVASRIGLSLDTIQKAIDAAAMIAEASNKDMSTGMTQAELAGVIVDELIQVIRDAAQVAMQIAAGEHSAQDLDEMAGRLQNIVKGYWL